MEIKYHLIVPTADNAVVCAKNFDPENPERISWYLGRFSDPNKLTFDSVEEALEKRTKTDPLMFPALVVIAAADGVAASRWKPPAEDEAVKAEVPEEIPGMPPDTSAQVKGWPQEVTLEIRRLRF